MADRESLMAGDREALMTGDREPLMIGDRELPRVLVLADDLIWSTRLVGLVRAAGADAILAATETAFATALAVADRVLIDLTARSYDGLAAVARASAAGRPVICVGQHDDHALRRRALAAGATRVYAYRKLHQDGPATIALWLGLPVPVPEIEATPAGG